MADELVGRRVAITIGAKRYEGLRVSFKIRKSLKPDPNTAEIDVYNLAESSRAELQSEKLVPILLEAGYQDTIQQIFVGNLRTSASVRDGAEWVTMLRSGDGEAAARIARINKSFNAGALVTQLVDECAKAMGVEVGNAAELAGKGKFNEAVKSLTSGRILTGPVHKVMKRLTRAAGLEYSIQDGQLQLLERGKALAQTAVLLTPNSGLLGSLERGEKGRVRGRSLLRGDIFPGRKLQIESRLVTGTYRCDVAEYVGDNFGEEFITAFESRPL